MGEYGLFRVRVRVRALIYRVRVRVRIRVPAKSYSSTSTSSISPISVRDERLIGVDFRVTCTFISDETLMSLIYFKHLKKQY
jgi:hypothetical protein